MSKCTLTCSLVFYLRFVATVVPEYFSYMLQNCHMEKLSGCVADWLLGEDGWRWTYRQNDCRHFGKITRKRRGGTMLWQRETSPRRKRQKRGKSIKISLNVWWKRWKRLVKTQITSSTSRRLQDYFQVQTFHPEVSRRLQVLILAGVPALVFRLEVTDQKFLNLVFHLRCELALQL